MSGFSEWLRDAVLEHFFTDGTAPTRPTEWWVALLDESGDEIQISEDENYERQAVGFETFSAPFRLRNDAAVTFPAAGPGADYDVHAWGVFDDETGGEELGRIELDFPRHVEEAQQLQFAVGDLVVGMD